ncbi:hypothetical protein BT96DRAFT_1008537 [Gymnopus androsaceus JB14]|uniref:Uncharacterized protein n=1 Tax=Gymnopus androsaceus JB14 TaxID=1447944 RepID=A0A6A4GEM9_9AGAR|nr:hypothetical protein BT96DRAFT_1008537 [Gymnopus androsaceus JB14]
MTPDLIQTAFRKTGLWPVDWTVVTQDMMAPSKATSTKVFTPVEMATPVCVVTELLIDVARPVCLLHEKEEGDSEDVEGEAIDNLEKDGQPSSSSTETALVHTPNRLRCARIALPKLHSTDLAFLVSKSPMKSAHNLPNLQTFALSPVGSTKSIVSDVLALKPKTTNEQRLLEGLQMQTERLTLAKGQVLQLQGQAVLQQLYANRVQTQVAAKEEKVLKKGKGKGRLLKDGLPRLLTGDAFFQHVVEHEMEVKEKENKKEARKTARELQAAELVLWEQEDQKRRERNEAKTHAWKAALVRWESDRAVANRKVLG